MSPLTLKDGTILPKGSYVCVPSIDPEADPITLSRPFDGFRWARLRQNAGNENKYLGVTTRLASGFPTLSNTFPVTKRSANKETADIEI